MERVRLILLGTFLLARLQRGEPLFEGRQKPRRALCAAGGRVLAGLAICARSAAVVGAVCFYRRRSKGSEAKPSAVDSPPPPKLVPLKARPEEEATVLPVAPEAEETLPARSAAAKGWFAAEPEGEQESTGRELISGNY